MSDNRLRVLLWSILLVAFGVIRVEAATLTLSWDASPESVSGYVVHVGTTSGAYTQTFDVGAVTSFVYSSVTAGQRYCFAVSAYLSGPKHGPKSEEVCGYGDQGPLFTSPGNQTSVMGQSDALQLQASDPEGRPVTYAVNMLPAGLTLMPSTGLISGTPTRAQTVNVSATVSDGLLTSTRSFTWTVQSSMTFGSLTADRVAPQAANTPITFTASAHGGIAPYQYRWYVHDGSAWQMLRGWTTSPSFTWTPATANPNYRMTVWIKDANSATATWDVSGSMAFPVSAPLLASLSADRPAPLVQGAAVTFNTAVSGGKAPYQYRWYVHDGSAWQMLRDWTSSPSFTWAPTAPNSAYRVTVWVKAADSTSSTWDTSATMAFPVTPPLEVSISADRFAPQAAGSSVTFTANGVGGKGPYQFRWWVYDGSSWVMLRDWSTSSSFTWTPPAANAAYRITVWAKNADSTTTTWDTSASMAFAIR